MSSWKFLSFEYKLGMGLWLAAGVVCLIVLIFLRRKARRSNRPGLWTGLVHASLSLWMLLVCLTGLELYFAFFFDQSDSFNMSKVSDLWFQKHAKPQERLLQFQSKQHHVYRDRRTFPSADPTESSQHLLCFIGDSFTYGHGLKRMEDRFSDLTADKLEEHAPGKFSVYNLANVGLDLKYQKQLVDQLHRDEFGIDTIVYVLCLNDIESYDSRQSLFYEETQKYNPEFFLFRESYFLNLVYIRLRQFSRPEVQNYYSFVHEFYAGEAWELMKQDLRQIHSQCDTQGVQFRMVIFPFLHRLSDDYAFDGVHHQIVEFCKTDEIPVLDLKPVLEPHAGEGLTVNPFDAHPNRLAHRLAAETITERLLRDLWEKGE